MTKSELRRISTLAAVRSLLGEGGGAMPVRSMAAALGMPKSTLMRHLSELRAVGAVSFSPVRDGRRSGRVISMTFPDDFGPRMLPTAGPASGKKWDKKTEKNGTKNNPQNGTKKTDATPMKINGLEQSGDKKMGQKNGKKWDKKTEKNGTKNNPNTRNSLSVSELQGFSENKPSCAHDARAGFLADYSIRYAHTYNPSSPAAPKNADAPSDASRPTDASVLARRGRELYAAFVGQREAERKKKTENAEIIHAEPSKTECNGESYKLVARHEDRRFLPAQNEEPAADEVKEELEGLLTNPNYAFQVVSKSGVANLELIRGLIPEFAGQIALEGKNERGIKLALHFAYWLSKKKYYRNLNFQQNGTLQQQKEGKLLDDLKCVNDFMLRGDADHEGIL